MGIRFWYIYLPVHSIPNIHRLPEVAETYPGAQVIGTDLSDIQPKWKLPNCSFIQDDAEDEWLFGSTEMPIQFDFIHLGLVVTCFNNPRTVMKHAYKNLRPGGWIEYMDVHLAASQALNHEEFIRTWCGIMG